MPFDFILLAEGFKPQGDCFRGDANLLLVWVLANSGIAVACFAMALVFKYFIGRRTDLPYRHMFILFAAFIVFCGISHIAQVVSIWFPFYRVQAFIDACTALVALPVAILFYRLIPKALALRRQAESDASNRERQIAKSNQELESVNQELHEANIALRIAHDQAIESSALKSAFIANLSHELRTPLSGVLGMNELLLVSPLDREQKMMAETVQDSARTLLSLVNDTLDLSKIEAGRMSIESIAMNPSEVAMDVVTMLTQSASNKGLVLSVEVGPAVPESVLGDPVRIHQILLNLVGNAIKFTSEGHVELRVSLKHSDANCAEVLFEVEDSGIGISSEESTRLFIPFMQAAMSTTRKYGGTGLGLAISKRLVELMGGEIGFQSEKGKGSKFWFNIPFLFRPRLPGVESFGVAGVPLPPCESRFTVLVVEDNLIIQSLIGRQLRSLGLNCKLVGTAEEGLEELRKSASVAGSDSGYGLVLMDCHLPAVDGLEAATRIRQWERNTGKHVSIVAVTAVATKGLPEKCLEAGMDDYLVKPYTLDQLREKLERWLPDAGGKGSSLARQVQPAPGPP